MSEPEEKTIFHNEVFKILKSEIGDKKIWGKYAKVNPFLKSASFITEDGTIRWRAREKVTEKNIKPVYEVCKKYGRFLSINSGNILLSLVILITRYPRVEDDDD